MYHSPKMEELFEILTDWVRKLDSSDVQDVKSHSIFALIFFISIGSPQRDVDNAREGECVSEDW